LCYIKPSLRFFTNSTEIIPFDRKSPQMIVKYMRFRNQIPKKRKAASPLKELLKATEEQALTSLKESNNLPQRLSKRLSDLGMFSRHYAEELIRAGVFFVDNKRVNDPSIIVGQDSSLTLRLPKKILFPLPLNLKLWLYHKPSGCTITKESHDVSYMD